MSSFLGRIVYFFSANVYEPFGKCDESVLNNFDVPSIIWGIDGNWMVNYIPKGILFNPTDHHCGVIRVLDESIVNPRYLTYALEQAGIKRASHVLKELQQKESKLFP